MVYLAIAVIIIEFVNNYDTNSASLISGIMQPFPILFVIFAYISMICGMYSLYYNFIQLYKIIIQRKDYTGHGDCCCCNCGGCDKLLTLCCKVPTRSKIKAIKQVWIKKVGDDTKKILITLRPKDQQNEYYQYCMINKLFEKEMSEKGYDSWILMCLMYLRSLCCFWHCWNGPFRQKRDAACFECKYQEFQTTSETSVSRVGYEYKFEMIYNNSRYKICYSY